MNEQILKQLETELYEHYKSLRNSFIFMEIYDGIFVLNWAVRNDEYINKTRIKQYTKFILNFLRKHEQEGFFYVGGIAVEVKSEQEAEIF